MMKNATSSREIDSRLDFLAVRENHRLIRRNGERKLPIHHGPVQETRVGRDRMVDGDPRTREGAGKTKRVH